MAFVLLFTAALRFDDAIRQLERTSPSRSTSHSLRERNQIRIYFKFQSPYLLTITKLAWQVGSKYGFTLLFTLASHQLVRKMVQFVWAVGSKYEFVLLFTVAHDSMM